MKKLIAIVSLFLVSCAPPPTNPDGTLTGRYIGTFKGIGIYRVDMGGRLNDIFIGIKDGAPVSASYNTGGKQSVNVPFIAVEK